MREIEGGENSRLSASARRFTARSICGFQPPSSRRQILLATRRRISVEIPDFAIIVEKGIHNNLYYGPNLRICTSRFALPHTVGFAASSGYAIDAT